MASIPDFCKMKCEVKYSYRYVAKPTIKRLCITGDGLVEYAIGNKKYTYRVSNYLHDRIIKLNSRSSGKAFNLVKRKGQLISKEIIGDA